MLRRAADFSVFFVLFSTIGGAFFQIIRRSQLGYLSIDEGVPIESDNILRYLNITCCSILLIYFAYEMISKKYIFRHEFKNLSTLQIILVTASAIWSGDPGFTLQKAFLFLCCNIFGFLLFRKPTWLEKWMRNTILIFIVSTFVFVVFLPQLALSQANHIGSVRGIFPHKNILGQTMVLQFIYLLARIITNKRNYYDLFLALVVFIIIWLSDSKTAVLVCSAAIVYTLFVRYIHRVKVRSIKTFLISLISLFLSIFGFGYSVSIQYLSEQNADVLLTGRVAIWTTALTLMRNDEKSLGYGFNEFWQNYVSNGPGFYAFLWHPPTGHNSYLDIILNFGIFLSAVLFIFIFRYMLLAFNNAIDKMNFTNIFAGLIFFCSIIYGFSESIIMAPFGIWTVFISLAILIVSKNQRPLSES